MLNQIGSEEVRDSKMVIDLTQDSSDSDMEVQAQLHAETKQHSPVLTLAHRNTTTLPSVPQKRKPGSSPDGYFHVGKVPTARPQAPQQQFYFSSWAKPKHEAPEPFIKNPLLPPAFKTNGNVSSEKSYPGNDQIQYENKPINPLFNAANGYSHGNNHLLASNHSYQDNKHALTPNVNNHYPISNHTLMANHFALNKPNFGKHDELEAPELVKKPLPKTPSPSPRPGSAHSATVNVIVPSPSRKLQQELDSAKLVTAANVPRGICSIEYPLDDFDRRALKGAYPTSKRVSRDSIPLAINKTTPILTANQRVNPHKQLQRTLQSKMDRIKGPKVTFMGVPHGKEDLIAQLVSHFEFINCYKIREGVAPVAEEFIGGCGCEGGFCNPKRCMCLDTEEDSDRKIVPYRPSEANSRLLVLPPEFMKRRIMIQECGAKCNCGDTCWNRVVQRGRTVRLEVFYTGGRGFGLRSPDPIHAGQFIDCYLGEVLTKDKADIREDIALLQHGHSYLFGLDFFPDVPDEEMFVVDGEKFGAATRFMNHSCNPNCRMFPVTHTPGDERLYDLAFFALRDIPPNAELTFDYNPSEAGTDQPNRKQKIDPNAVKCLCGERNCRGQLWPNQRKGTK